MSDTDQPVIIAAEDITAAQEALEIKPCPFCGVKQCSITGIGEYFFVVCAPCDARGPISIDGNVSIRLWNEAPRRNLRVGPITHVTLGDKLEGKITEAEAVALINAAISAQLQCGTRHDHFPDTDTIPVDVREIIKEISNG